MQVTPINSQNNISHKAYFKPNEAFNRLYGKHYKNFSQETIAKLKNLPEHKLEIVGTRLYERVLEMDVFNTFTNKTATYELNKEKPFESLIKGLSSEKSKDFFTEEASITKNYLTITMPTLSKKK